MPDLSDELEALDQATDNADYDDEGYMTPERHARVRAKIIAGVKAVNARFAAEAARG